MEKLKRMAPSTRSSFITYGMVIVAYAVMEALLSGGLLKSSLKGLLVPICAYVVMAVSLNLTVGIMGELSLGHAGFMSVGAFTAVIAAAALESTVTSGPVRLAVSMAIGGVAAGLVSLIVVVPVLRLQGDYLAIVTLAFGEIIKNIINCVYVGLDGEGFHFGMKDAASLGLAADGKMLLQGPMGAVGIQKLSSFTAGFLLILLTLAVALNFIHSRAGRAVMALRDNRIAAESVGISPSRYKMMAFVTSAVLAGLAGGLYAMNFSSILAKKFDFNTSILILVFVVLGGMGNIRGSVIAAAALTVLPELLRDFSDYRMLVYAIVLILVMLFTNNPACKTVFARFKLGSPAKKEAV
ncbi:branched-chain amino acid ABC transporter permease protein [Oscillibacter valericigenes Sjm18-20]|nr:branched-chain amino acid ABC transporter permease protein [Oscillibacter valericigenes Sjm18-20]